MDSLIQKNQILRMKFRMADKNGHFEHLFLGEPFCRTPSVLDDTLFICVICQQQ